jgi:hypothetical protein
MQEHMQQPEAELEELTQIYVGRGLTYYLAKQVSDCKPTKKTTSRGIDLSTHDVNHQNDFCNVFTRSCYIL